MHIDIATDALLIIKLNISVWKYITERKKVFFLFGGLTLLNYYFSSTRDRCPTCPSLIEVLCMLVYRKF